MINFFREGKDMTANQAKVGMETAKEVNNDPELKTKQDKERRLKEKTANNAKKFLQVTTDSGIRHGTRVNGAGFLPLFTWSLCLPCLAINCLLFIKKYLFAWSAIVGNTLFTDLWLWKAHRIELR